MVDTLDYTYALKGDDLKIWFGDRGSPAYFEGTFGEDAGIKGDFYGGRGGGREEAGVQGGVPYVVEGEARSMRGVLQIEGVGDGAQVAGGDAGLEDQIPMRLGYARAVVDHVQDAVAAALEGRGNVDALGTGVAGVAEELEEGFLYVP